MCNNWSIKMEDYIANQIKNYLKQKCPAFSYTGKGTCLWHGCECATYGICTCVWHVTSTCEARHWSGLEFVDDARKKDRAQKELMESEVKAVKE